MAMTFEAEVVPLQVDEAGAIRVRGSRITLDTIVAAFKEGATAEEIAQQYPTLELADVYAILGYYLRRQNELEEYLNKRHQHATAIRRGNESRFNPQGVRERLLRRRNQ